MDRKDTIQENYREKKFLKYTSIIVILLLIVFFATRELWFIEHKAKYSGSCVDIFNITIGPDCDCDDPNRNPDHDDPTEPDDPDKDEPTNPDDGDKDKDKDKDDDKGNSGNNNDDKKPTPSVPVDKGVEVFDKDTHYSVETPLDIFSKSTSHVVNGKIAPGLANSYNFVIKNNNSFTINYQLEMTEKNDDYINIQFKLKQNGKYIIGSKDKWVSSEELKMQQKTLSAYKQDSYTLEWKWVEADNDTHIGSNLDSSYELNLRVYAYK